jgi:hypothetical protein
MIGLHLVLPTLARLLLLPRDPLRPPLLEHVEVRHRPLRHPLAVGLWRVSNRFQDATREFLLIQETQAGESKALFFELVLVVADGMAILQ